MNWLAAYAILATVVLLWALLELKVERSSSRLIDRFRENDRKFYRGWENIWFAQLKKMAESAPKKQRLSKKRDTSTRRPRKG